MSWKKDDSVDKIVEKFKPFNMHVSPDLIQRTAKALVMAKSEDSKRIFQNMLKQFENKIQLLRLKTDKPFIEVPEFREGPVSLGRYLQQQEFHECRIQINDLIQTSINAAPNKGKTNLLFHLCSQIAEYNRSTEKRIAIIVLDRKKDFRNLPIDAAVLRLEDLRINFFDPPSGYDAVKWISDMANTLMHSWGWAFASRNYFMRKVNDIYERKRKPPTMYEIYESVKADKESVHRQTNRQLEIEEVNLDRIETATREFGPCFSSRKTFQLHEFIESAVPLVIEADVSTDSFALLLSWLLQYIHKLNKTHDIRGNIGDFGGTLVVCDEAYVLWETSRDYSESRRELGANFVSLAPLYVRDFRTAIVAASQRPLSPDYMSAANLRMIGWTGDYKDAQYYANSLGDPCLVEVIQKLGVGEYLVKVGDRPAALVKVPYVKVERKSDDDIKESMSEYRAAVLEYCREEVEEAKPEKPAEKISDETKALLINVCDYPDATISFRYEKLGWKTSLAQDLVKEAIRSGYLHVVEDMIDSQKKAKYLVPTQKGIDWLRSQHKDVRYINHVGNTGPQHALYQNILVSRLRRLKWNVMHDHFLADKLLDVYGESQDGKKVGFEIAIHPAVDVRRALSVLDHVDEYFFLCRDLIIAEAIRSQMSGPKVRFVVASDYLLSLKRSILDYYTKDKENSTNSQDKQDSTPDSHEEKEDRRND